MKRIIVVVAAALFVAAWGVASAEDAAPAKDAPGKELYLKYSCNSCHTMAAQKIEKKASASEGEAKEAAATKEAGEEASSTKKKAPDLSGVGTVHTADFIVKYLQKLEAIKEKKHMKKFKGTDEELTQLAAWLAEQKDVEAAKKATEGASKEGEKEEAAPAAETK